MPRLVSFEVSADFGFFKKPDINKIGLTYNLPPKPAILGLLGSVLGLKGYKQHYEEKSLKKEKGYSFPEYYSKLAHIKIGITPLGDFPFNKVMNKYNSKNSYFYTRTDSGNRIDTANITEQILIKPKYLIYLYTEKEDDLTFENLVKFLRCRKSIYIPYLGKNDFILSIENLEEINEFDLLSKKQKITIKTVFLTNPIKNDTKNQEAFEMPKFHSVEGLSKDEFGKPVIDIDFYENYPIGYLDSSMQYNLKLARFTTFKVESDKLDTTSGILIEHNKQILYLF